MTYSIGIAHVEPAPSVAPDPEMKPGRRRKFTDKAKLRILDKVDALQKGEVAAYLRREGLYSTMLGRWRDDRAAGRLASPQAQTPTAEPRPDRDLPSLRRKVLQLERLLKQAETIVEAQKKLLSLFEFPGDVV